MLLKDGQKEQFFFVFSILSEDLLMVFFMGYHLCAETFINWGDVLWPLPEMVRRSLLGPTFGLTLACQ